MIDTSPGARRGILPNLLQDRRRSFIREAILDAAEEAFVSYGFRMAKMVAIARAAGVSVGTLYNYFDGKEPLFRALLTRHRNRHSRVVEAGPNGSDPIERLYLFVARSLAFVEDNGRVFSAYQRELARQVNGVAGSVLTIETKEEERRLGQRVTQLLDEGVQSGHFRGDLDTEELGWTLTTLLLAAVTRWLELASPTSLRLSGHRVVQSFLYGVLRR